MRGPKSTLLKMAAWVTLGTVGSFFVYCAAAAAADWPSRPVSMIVPFAPGGNTDTVARVLGESLYGQFGQPFLIDNRAGASGAIGTSAVTRSAPDGYNLLFAAVQQVSVIQYTEHVNFDADKELTPISLFADGPFVLAVSSTIPVKSIDELIDYAGKRPNELSYASGGVGSLTQLAGALLAEKAGIKLIHVPYRGGGPILTDLLAGHIQVYFGSASELIPYAKDDHVRLIGVSTSERMPQLPEVPSVSEKFPGFRLTSWNGLLGPANLPQDVLSRLASAVAAAARDPKASKTLFNLGVTPVGDTPAEFKQRIVDERPLLREALQAANILPR